MTASVEVCFRDFRDIAISVGFAAKPDYYIVIPIGETPNQGEIDFLHKGISQLRGEHRT